MITAFRFQNRTRNGQSEYFSDQWSVLGHRSVRNTEAMSPKVIGKHYFVDCRGLSAVLIVVDDMEKLFYLNQKLVYKISNSFFAVS